MYFNFVFMKIDQIEGGVSRFEVNGVFYVKTRFLPGTSLFLPAGDACGEINIMTTYISK